MGVFTVTDTYTIEAEYTDTFGGEPNYCWVRRATLEMPQGSSDQAISRRLKKALGITGLRGVMYRHGDSWEFRPYGLATVMLAHVRC